MNLPKKNEKEQKREFESLPKKNEKERKTFSRYFLFRSFSFSFGNPITPLFRSFSFSFGKFSFVFFRSLSAIILSVFFSASAFSQSLPLLRSSQAALPESIQREVFAAIGRTHNPLDENASALLSAEEQISKPWDSDFALAVAYAAISDITNTLSPRVIAKLLRQDTAQFTPADTAFVLLALESNGVDCREKWRALAERLNAERSAEPEIARVALSALCHMMTAPRGDMSAPSPAALAHLRWIGKRLALGYDNTPTGADDDILTPETAFFTALSASYLPRTVFVADNPPLPYDWRNHLAARLVAQQRFNPNDNSYNWGADKNNAYAVFTLQMISSDN